MPPTGLRSCGGRARTLRAVPSAWSVKILLSFRTEEAVVARTPGASNRTPRELRAEAKRLVEKADHIEKTAALQKELEKAKAKRKESAR